MKNPYQPQHEIDATIVACPVVNSRGFVQLGGVSVQSNKVSQRNTRIHVILGLMVIRWMQSNLNQVRTFFGELSLVCSSFMDIALMESSLQLMETSKNFLLNTLFEMCSSAEH